MHLQKLVIYYLETQVGKYMQYMEWMYESMVFNHHPEVNLREYFGHTTYYQHWNVHLHLSIKLLSRLFRSQIAE